MNIKAPSWFILIAIGAMTMAGLTGYVYANFPSRIEFNALQSFIVDRLNRIESKLDQIIDHRISR